MPVALSFGEQSGVQTRTTAASKSAALVGVGMDLRSFHTPLEAPEHFRHLASAIAEAGLAPVFGQARQSVTEKLRMVGLTAPAAFSGSGEVEVLAQAEGDGAVVLRLVPNAQSEVDGNAFVADIRVLSATAAAQLEELVRQKVLTLSAHSWSEARLIDRIRMNVTEDGTDAMLLNDPERRQRIRELYDDRLRNALARLLGAARGERAREPMEWLRPFADDGETRQVLFGNPAIFAQRYAITCRSCDTAPHLAFSDRSRGESIIEEVGRTCVNCGETALEIAELYRISDEYVRSIQHGLWLKSLVADAVAGRTDASWTSRKVGRSDLDVVAIYADEIFLFTCKDGPVGPADVYATVRAAEQLDVDEAILVTTADVPRRTQEIVASLGAGPRIYRIISEQSSNAIRDAVQRVLDDAAWKYLDRSLADEGTVVTTTSRGGAAHRLARLNV